MDLETRAEIEGRIKSHHDSGRTAAMIALGVEAYGPEILGFLLAILRDEQRARDVYSDWSEDVCRGAAGFRWQSTFRTWAYTLARHAWHRFLARAQSSPTVPLSHAPEHLDLEVRGRTPTLPYVRTDRKQQVARLREQLGADEQALLILRVDRGLAWTEIAQVMAGPDGPSSAKARETEAAALRKRFERIKDHLRALAREAQLVTDE